MFWILYILLGLVAGFIAGIVGIGGGVLIVPALYVLLSTQGLSSIEAMQQSIATSLVVLIFTSLAGSISHVLKKGVIWKIFFSMTIGILFGAFLGPLTTTHTDSNLLKNALAAVEILMGVLLLFKLKSQTLNPVQKEPISHPAFFIPFGVVIGYLATLLGIGGGMFVAPTLLLLHHSTHRAVATSTMSIVPTALIGSISYFFLAKSAGYEHFYSILNLPALICLVSTTLVATPIGAHLCYKVPNKILRTALACILISIGILFFI